MKSSINGRWITPFKKFGMVRVNFILLDKMFYGVEHYKRRY